MARRFPDLPDCSFDAEEVSAGVYRAFGRDRIIGRKVEAFGVDPDALNEKCRRAALEIMSKSSKPTDSLRS
jgi:hypothetical protein